MTLPGLDSNLYNNLYGHPTILPFGNDHFNGYCDACDQFPNSNYLTASNQLTNINLKKNLINMSHLKSNHFNDHFKKTSTNDLNDIIKKSNSINHSMNHSNSFKSKLKSNNTQKLLKRRFSDNLISRLPIQTHSPDYNSSKKMVF